MKPVLKVTVQVLVTVEEQDGVYLADCPFLNIVTQGADEDEALARFREEMPHLFEAADAAGELEALLALRTTLRRGELTAGEYVSVGRTHHYVPAEIPAGLLQRFTDAAAAFH